MLGAAGYTPEQIDVVVLTHFHPDHIGGNLEDGKPAFANARYVSSAAEYDFWSPIDKASGPTERVGKLVRSEEHTSELQSLMRISYAVFCMKTKKAKKKHTNQ